jgi:hypothetical protein
VKRDGCALLGLDAEPHQLAPDRIDRVPGQGRSPARQPLQHLRFPAWTQAQGRSILFLGGNAVGQRKALLDEDQKGVVDPVDFRPKAASSTAGPDSARKMASSFGISVLGNRVADARIGNKLGGSSAQS